MQAQLNMVTDGKVYRQTALEGKETISLGTSSEDTYKTDNAIRLIKSFVRTERAVVNGDLHYRGSAGFFGLADYSVGCRSMDNDYWHNVGALFSFF